jgi:hypothetical protein
MTATLGVQRIGARVDWPEVSLGGLLADLFVGAILDGLIWGTGAIIIKAARPGRRVDETTALLLGLTVWLILVPSLVIGYLLLV